MPSLGLVEHLGKFDLSDFALRLMIALSTKQPLMFQI